MYDKLFQLLNKFFKTHTLFQYGFNISPMYRRSTGKIFHITEDLHNVKVKIPLSYKNSNYVGSLFGGSMLSATDPICMIQLMFILGKSYVVWDKATCIRFKRPARETAYVNFDFTPQEIEQIKQDVAQQNAIDIVKYLKITNKNGSVVFAEVKKTIYIADKSYYKHKRQQKKK